MKKTLYQAPIDLAGNEVYAAVLDDTNRTRVLSYRRLPMAFGLDYSGAIKSKEGGYKLPRFLSASNIMPFLSEDLIKTLSEPIHFIDKSGNDAHGVPAEVIYDICKAILDLDQEGGYKSQLNLIKGAYRLTLCFAKAGIISIIDEATGYLKDPYRSKNEIVDYFNKNYNRFDFVDSHGEDEDKVLIPKYKIEISTNEDFISQNLYSDEQLTNILTDIVPVFGANNDLLITTGNHMRSGKLMVAGGLDILEVRMNKSNFISMNILKLQ